MLSVVKKYLKNFQRTKKEGVYDGCPGARAGRRHYPGADAEAVRAAGRGDITQVGIHYSLAGLDG